MIDYVAPPPALQPRLTDMALVACWPVDAGLAECPHWIAEHNTLLWVDIVRPSINLLDLTTGASSATRLPAKIGSAAPGPDGTMVLALEDRLWLQDARQERRALVPPIRTATHFNDGKCDPMGRFWVGSRSSDGSSGKGSLYRLDADGRMIEMAQGFDVCNGLGWSPDGTAFYLIDTIPRLLYRYDYDLRSGTIANRRVLQDFAGVPGKPDGLAIDGDGNLWCAMWDGSGIQRLSPDGEQIGWLDTPCPRPTSCAFGGSDGRTLLVTTASHGLDAADPGFGLSGSILAFRASVGGTPVAAYGGSISQAASRPAAARGDRPDIGTPIDPCDALSAWRNAPVIPLWQSEMPGGSFSRPAELTEDFAPEMLANWPADFIRWVERPELRVFRPVHANGAAVLVMPGGAYAFISIRNEGTEVAERLNRHGYTVFVLTYRLPNEGWQPRWDVPLIDAQRAMRLIRARAAGFGIDPARVAALGFSAGGNLAANLATGFAERLHDPVDAIDAIDARPTAVGLIYPVITMRTPATHALSRRLLLGDAPGAERIDRRSAEGYVTATAPPLFLVHAVDDVSVPSENSLMIEAACRTAQRPCEMHLFQEGGHGFGVGSDGTPTSLWIEIFHLWLAQNAVG